MGRKFNDITDYTNKEVVFDHNGQEMVWRGDYSVRCYGEEPSWDYPGDAENEIQITHTSFIETWSDELEDWVKIIPTDELLDIVHSEIENTL